MVWRLLTGLALLTATAACANTGTDTVYDQCRREAYFHQCLAELPQGPQSTTYNDWDEAVDSCAQAAKEQSLRQRFAVPTNCVLEYP